MAIRAAARGCDGAGGAAGAAGAHDRLRGAEGCRLLADLGCGRSAPGCAGAGGLAGEAFFVVGRFGGAETGGGGEGRWEE